MPKQNRSSASSSSSANRNNNNNNNNNASTSANRSLDDLFTKECVYSHNEYRKKHRDTKPVISSKELSKVAATRAEKLVQIDRLEHLPQNNNDHYYGENLYMIYGGYSDCHTVTKSWYQEFDDENYDFQNPKYDGKTGHATQVIWYDTTRIGCAQRSFQSGGHYPKQYTVCMYDPAGNMIGRFKENVFPPLYR
ncbi:cysteine-rich secretory protein-like protein [Dermatophagoides farinae]|uniref:Cysteine-rich secretory protein-like protein n=1 Tax=Dermatophagoides farinae TaxID=6954 RepID=A0A9D4P7C6_DERFA|nr:cysteine-rich secretory protein-like protein [Dermatophagoides farinae]